MIYLSKGGAGADSDHMWIRPCTNDSCIMYCDVYVTWILFSVLFDCTVVPMVTLIYSAELECQKGAFALAHTNSAKKSSLVLISTSECMKIAQNYPQ